MCIITRLKMTHSKKPGLLSKKPGHEKLNLVSKCRFQCDNNSFCIVSVYLRIYRFHVGISFDSISVMCIKMALFGILELKHFKAYFNVL